MAFLSRSKRLILFHFTFIKRYKEKEAMHLLCITERVKLGIGLISRPMKKKKLWSSQADMKKRL